MSNKFIIFLCLIIVNVIVSINFACANNNHNNHRPVKSIIIAEPVNINKADEAELMLLTGIGAKKAKAIMAYRNQHGAFKSISEIKKVSGISKSVYSKIKSIIIV
jgi:comEA protein